MRTRNTLRALMATAAIAVSFAVAAPALASGAPPSVTLSNFADPDTLPGSQFMVANFNDTANPNATLVSGFNLTLNGATVGVDEGMGGYSGTLYNDPSTYLTIPTGASADLTSDKGLTSLSLYMGSPDTYNWIRFIGDNGYDVTLPGSALVLGDTNQSWDWGKRATFNFGSERVHEVIFSATGNSFELDNIAAGVPEAGTWALMILGFGGAGAMLRRRRAATVAGAATA